MLRKSHLLFIAFLLLAVGLHADNIVDEIVARVNSSIITRTDLERGKQQNEEDLKQRFPSDWQSKWAGREKDLLRDLIDRQLLVEKGKDLGITGETEMIKRLNELRQQFGLNSMEELEKAAQQQGVSYEDFKEQIRTEIVTSKVISQEVGSHVAREINNTEVQKWYDQHQKELAVPEQVTLAEILVSTQPPKPPTDDKNKDAAAQAPQLPPDPAKVVEAEVKANDLLEQLHKGAKFDELARKSSDGTTAAQGGLIGDFKRGEMDKELEDRIFPLKAGEITGVIHTKPGFIIFKVVAHQPSGIPPLAEVDSKIRDALYVQKLEPAARSYLTKLREESFIDIKPGFVDTGASPNESKPVIIAASTSGDQIKQAKAKKKKHFLVF
ncbi:MAG TPA: peptidylprolyl isomerase [Candidatus Angelobacter sp.]